MKEKIIKHIRQFPMMGSDYKKISDKILSMIVAFVFCGVWWLALGLCGNWMNLAETGDYIFQWWHTPFLLIGIVSFVPLGIPIFALFLFTIGFLEECAGLFWILITYPFGEKK